MSKGKQSMPTELTSQAMQRTPLLVDGRPLFRRSVVQLLATGAAINVAADCGGETGGVTNQTGAEHKATKRKAAVRTEELNNDGLDHH